MSTADFPGSDSYPASSLPPAPVRAPGELSPHTYSPTSSVPASEPAGSEAGSGVAEAVAGEASSVAGDVKDASANVVGVAKHEASTVTKEAGRQAKDLLEQTRSELMVQAADQQQRVAGGLRSLGQELSAMANSTDQPGIGADLAHQIAGRAGAVAGWLEDREPGALLAEVTSFARSRPGAFLALAAGAGILAGRLTRGLTADTPGAVGAEAESVRRPERAPASHVGTDDGDWTIGYPVAGKPGVSEPYLSSLAGNGSGGFE